VWNLEQLKSVFALVRDVFLLGGGLLFAYDEIMVAASADPQVLVLAAAMMGLGLIFRA
jgi:hypothetical protein